MKKVCIVTSTRAEFGLLLPLIRKVMSDSQFDMRLAVTGSHLCKRYGETYIEIIENKIPIDTMISILQDNDDEISILQTMGTALIEFGKYFKNLMPDIVVILGDRYEMLSVAEASMICNIPVAHIHGGETTEGAIDESIRHSITKMSYLHFTSCEAYRNRVIQLGESPNRVFNVGALGVENIKKLSLMTKKELEDSINFKLEENFALVTFHPVTLGSSDEKVQFEELLNALNQFSNMKFIFTKSNADSGGNIINDMIDDYVEKHNNCISFYSLGFVRYLSAMKYCRMVIGNSSSGIIEAPSFCVPTINIGNRQKGRIQANSIINCSPITQEIINSINLANSEQFNVTISNCVSPYGNGNTSEKILNTLKELLLNDNINLQKSFYDIKG